MASRWPGVLPVATATAVFPARASCDRRRQGVVVASGQPEIPTAFIGANKFSGTGAPPEKSESAATRRLWSRGRFWWLGRAFRPWCVTPRYASPVALPQTTRDTDTSGRRRPQRGTWYGEATAWLKVTQDATGEAVLLRGRQGLIGVGPWSGDFG